MKIEFTPNEDKQREYTWEEITHTPGLYKHIDPREEEFIFQTLCVEDKYETFCFNKRAKQISLEYPAKTWASEENRYHRISGTLTLKFD